METQSPYNLLQKLPDSRVELIRATLFTGGADECHTAVWKLPQGVVVCVAPHGLRCMHPNRYSNRCEIIQPPSLMTAHMNSVSSEYPLWVNLHSSKWSGSQDTPRPATASPQGGEAFHLPSKTPEEWWRVANQSLRPCPHHTSSRKRKRIAGHSVCPSSCPPVHGIAP